MSYTRMRPTKTETRSQPAPESLPQVHCTGHNKLCKRIQAGPLSKNPGRWFYTCPLGRDNPQQCKFFKWEDKIFGGNPGTTSPSVGQTEVSGGGRTLGGGNVGRLSSPTKGSANTTRTLEQSPAGRTLGSAAATIAAARPGTQVSGPQSSTPKAKRTMKTSTLEKYLSPSRKTSLRPSQEETLPSQQDSQPSGSAESERIEVFDSGDEDDADDLDWGIIDADAMERDAAERATPRTARINPVNERAPIESPATSAAVIEERLRDASSLKRKRQDDEPMGVVKRAASANPFLDSDNSKPSRAAPLQSDKPAPPLQTNKPGPYPLVVTNNTTSALATPTRPRPSGPDTPVQLLSAHSAHSAHSLNPPASELSVSEVSDVSFSSLASHRDPALQPTLQALEGLADHLARQDRLVRAAEAMKRNMRQTIRSLQERNTELEERVRVLEAQARERDRESAPEGAGTDWVRFGEDGGGGDDGLWYVEPY